MKSSPIRVFSVGDWTVHPRRNELTRGGRTKRIEPKMMRVLVCLSERAGEVVSRDELLESVWPDVVVGDHVLTRAVSELRRVLGDNSADPAYIATVIKGGYRLVAPVSSVSQRSSKRIAAIGAAVVVGLSIFVVGVLALGRSKAPTAGAPAVVPLTFHPSLEYDPALSPDGRQIAWVWDGTDGASWDIYVSDVEDLNPRRLTSERGADGSPTWSPDGLRIAYYRFDGECVLYVRSAAGGEERRLGSCNARYPDLSWSPNGDRIVFNERQTERGPYRLVEIDIVSGIRRYLTDPAPTHFGDHHAKYSPDGESVAFVRTVSEGIEDVFVIPAVGGAPDRLTHDGRNVYGLDWIENGRSLVIASNRDGSSSLWKLSLDGRRMARFITNDRAGNPTVAGNGMVYERWSSDVNLWKLDVIGGVIESASALVASTRWDMHPGATKSGERVAFSSNRSGTYEIWLKDQDADVRALTDFSSGYVGRPRWSPDGTRLAFDARTDGQADVYVQNVADGFLDRLTGDATDDLAAGWSSDGSYVYFTSNRGGSWNLWRMDISDKSSEIVVPGGYAASESPDGRRLYFTRFAEQGVWRVTPGRTDTILVHADLAPSDAWNWAITEAGLYTVRRHRSPRIDSLIVVDPDSRSVTMLGALPYPLPAGDPAYWASRDGATLIVGQRESQGADLMSIRLDPEEGLTAGISSFRRESASR